MTVKVPLWCPKDLSSNLPFWLIEWLLDSTTTSLGPFWWNRKLGGFLHQLFGVVGRGGSCAKVYTFLKKISNAEKMQDSLRMVLNFPAILGLACLQEWISGITVLWFSSSTGFPKGHWLWEIWEIWHWSQGLVFTGAWQASDVASEEVTRAVLFLRCIKCLGNSLFSPTSHLSIWKCAKSIYQVVRK